MKQISFELKRIEGMVIMKKLFLLLVVANLVAGLQSCLNGNNKQETSQNLVVVEQSDTIWNRAGEYDYDASFTVDVPIDGPQALVDSVMALLNMELHSMCERTIHFDNQVSFKEKEVCTDDAKNLLNHYIKKYKSLIEDILEWHVAFKLKLEAQTEQYVTYGIECYHCGGSCGSEKFYYTFSKSDGHQVKDIISRDDLLRFLKEHPECKDNEDMDKELWQMFPLDEYQFENSNYGLLGDHFSLVIWGYTNHYLSTEFPYSKILPYLSPEAQELVGKLQITDNR